MTRHDYAAEIRRTLVHPRDLCIALDLAEETVTSDGDCWVWRLGTDKDGYGLLKRVQKHWRAHRFVFAQLIEDPGSSCVLHRCDNPSCVRPDHLFLGSIAENNADRDAKGRTCKGDRHRLRQQPKLAWTLGWSKRKRVAHGNTHPAAKLTEESARRARDLSASGLGARRIASELGVSRSAIRFLLKGKTWKHVA